VSAPGTAAYITARAHARDRRGLSPLRQPVAAIGCGFCAVMKQPRVWVGSLGPGPRDQCKPSARKRLRKPCAPTPPSELQIGEAEPGAQSTSRSYDQ
jgi:hypothetical protein